MEQTKKDKPWCELTSLTEQAKDIQITSDYYTIGRKETKDAQIKNSKLSSVHCIIRREKQADGSFSYYIQDLSSNGTFYTKVKIGKKNKSSLKSNDEIMLLNNKHVPDKGKGTTNTIRNHWISI